MYGGRNLEELIEVLDCNGNKTGEIKPKSEIKKAGDYHRAIAVCIINDNNKVCINSLLPDPVSPAIIPCGP